MGRLTPQQRNAVLRVLPTGQHPAAPELVEHVAKLARDARTAGRGDSRFERLAAAVVDHTPAVLGRLVEAEREAAGLRWVVADLLAALDLGDEVLAMDIVERVRAVRINLEADLEAARAIRQARARAEAML